MSDDALELEYEHAEEPDPNADAPDAPVDYRIRSVPKHQSDSTWLLEYAKRRNAARTTGPFDVGGHITVLSRSVGLEGQPPAMQRLIDGLADEWIVRCSWTRTAVSDLFYVGDADGHSKGDIRTPAHEMTYWSVRALLRAPAGRVASFWATWKRKTVPGAKPGGNTFQDVSGWDPVQQIWYSKQVGELVSWLEVFSPSL